MPRISVPTMETTMSALITSPLSSTRSTMSTSVEPLPLAGVIGTRPTPSGPRSEPATGLQSSSSAPITLAAAAAARRPPNSAHAAR